MAAALLAALLVACALAPITVGRGEAAKTPSLVGHGSIRSSNARDKDLALYDRAIARIRAGENYYSFIVAEQRLAHYPVRPGLAVRLPTLAYLDAAMGIEGEHAPLLPKALALALMLGTVAAWWGRLGAEGASERERRFGTLLMLFGASLGVNVYFFTLHELWSGMLIALSLGLHRPTQGRWAAAWWAAALALAIRELALPYVLLMGAMAGWRARAGAPGAAREAAAWGALALAFAAGLGWHLHLIAAQALPSDPVGPGWLALRGLTGWISDVALSSNLRFLPHWLAGPAMVLMMAGWAGWNTPAGRTGALLYGGYGVLFMLAGRPDNFYWGAMVAPAMFVGLAFMPMALGGLWRACALTRG